MARRTVLIVGFVVALVLGLVVGAYAAGNAFLIGQSASGLTPADEAEMIRLWVAAAAAPFVTIGGYAVVVLLIRRMRSRSR